MATDFMSLVATAKRKNAKKSRKPYVLSNLPNEEKPITIPFPDATKLLDYEEAPTANAKLQIIMSPADYRRFRAALKGVDGEVVTMILDEIWELWGDDSEEVPGGKELSEN
jgi:hypothetical protein